MIFRTHGWPIGPEATCRQELGRPSRRHASCSTWCSLAWMDPPKCSRDADDVSRTADMRCSSKKTIKNYQHVNRNIKFNTTLQLKVYQHFNRNNIQECDYLPCTCSQERRWHCCQHQLRCLDLDPGAQYHDEKSAVLTSTTIRDDHARELDLYPCHLRGLIHLGRLYHLYQVIKTSDSTARRPLATGSDIDVAL